MWRTGSILHYSFPNPPGSLLPAWLCAEVEVGLVLYLGSVTADFNPRAEWTHPFWPTQPQRLSPGAIVPNSGLIAFLKEHSQLGGWSRSQSTRGKLRSLDYTSKANLCLDFCAGHQSPKQKNVFAWVRNHYQTFLDRHSHHSCLPQNRWASWWHGMSLCLSLSSAWEGFEQAKPLCFHRLSEVHSPRDQRWVCSLSLISFECMMQLCSLY